MSSSLPWLIIKGSEEHTNQKRYLKLVGYYIGKLASMKKIQCGKASLKPGYRGLLGDNKQLWIDLGNNLGGIFRCFGCNIHFRKELLRSTVDFSSILNSLPKGTVFNFKLFFTNKICKDNEEIIKKAKEMGIGIPYLLQSIAATLIKENNSVFQNVEDCIPVIETLFETYDNLHPLKGVEKSLFSELINLKRIDKSELEKNLFIHLKRRKLSELDGKKMNELLLKADLILLPILQRNIGNQDPIFPIISEIFINLQYISWLSYQPSEVEDRKGIQLWFYYICFQLGEQMLKLPTEFHLFNLYLHEIVAHFPNFFVKKVRLKNIRHKYSKEFCQNLKKYLNTSLIDNLLMLSQLCSKSIITKEHSK